ncbi:MAG TPA: hypothetical protein VFQ44_22175 [Streptosporangiaceae bacterium]|nr:hypothetical protein [Streptosporangiaceae bacterium]
MRYHGFGVAALLLAGAAASVAGSTAALRLIDNTAISPGGTPLTQAEVRRTLTGTSPGGPGSQQSPPATSRPPASPSDSARHTAPVSFTAAGSTVFASCNGGKVTLTSWIPAQGFESDGFRRGPAVTAWVNFKSGSSEVTVTASCSNGQPRFTTAADDHHGGNGGGEDEHRGGSGGSGGGSSGGGHRGGNDG